MRRRDGSPVRRKVQPGGEDLLELIKDRRPDWLLDQPPDRRSAGPSTPPASGDIMVG
jgi:hypothetical protein